MDNLVTLHSMPRGAKLFQVLNTQGALGGCRPGPRRHPQGPILKLWVRNRAHSAAVSQVPEAATIRCLDVSENGRLIVTGSGDYASVYHVTY